MGPALAAAESAAVAAAVAALGVVEVVQPAPLPPPHHLRLHNASWLAGCREGTWLLWQLPDLRLPHRHLVAYAGLALLLLMPPPPIWGHRLPASS